MLTDGCRLCPRNCGADRASGVRGFCNVTNDIMAARAALHYWEEPCISGTAGSGAVFFSGCALRCVFCQNEKIRNGQVGKVITADRLTDIFLELQDKGANNINLVTAGHFLPRVIDALENAKTKGLIIPVVYNTSSYEKVEAIRALDGLVDIYLPDLKFMSTELSSRFAKAPDYFKTASEAIKEMVRQTGDAEFYIKKSSSLDKQLSLWASDDILNAEEYNECADDLMEAGYEVLMRRGTIVRHLLLPGCYRDSEDIISYLYETYGDKIFISIMNQYTPMPQVADDPDLSRKVTEEEYNRVLDHAIDIGVENAFIQEGDVAEESFIPDFDNEGI